MVDKIIILNRNTAEIVYDDRAPLRISSGEYPIDAFIVWFLDDTVRCTFDYYFSAKDKDETTDIISIGRVG